MRLFFVPFCGLVLVGVVQARAQNYTDLLVRYRAEPGCQGPAYALAAEAAGRSYTEYHVTPATAPDSVRKGRIAAAETDALAETQAAKGCKALALENFRFVIRIFDGPVFADLQRRAVIGLRGLRS
jgi:hypothetical protein